MNIVKTIASAFFVTLLAMPLAQAENNQQETYNLNAADIGIVELTKVVSNFTGRQFLLTPKVKGRVQIITTEAMNAEEVYETYLSVLQASGFSAVESGKVTKIVSHSDVRTLNGPVDYNGDSGIEGEQMITSVVAVKNVAAGDLLQVIRPILAKYGHLAAVPSLNLVVMHDHAANVKRMQSVIQKMDVSGNMEMEIVKLNYAWVGDTMNILEKLYPAPAQGSSQGKGHSYGVLLVADERSNSIILKGDKDARNTAKKMIKKLDVKADQGDSKVIYLNNADAKTMAGQLKELSTGATQAEAGVAAKIPVVIIADEGQNALIIRAEPVLLADLEMIISLLDVPRQQVLIEAAIVEVSGGKLNQLGVSWATNPETTVPIISDFGTAGASLTALATGYETGGTAGALATVGNGITMGIVDPYSNPANFGLVLKAIEDQNDAKILQTPYLTTINNKEAEISIGQNVPFITGGQQEGNNPFVNNITREDVGTKLNVIPHIQNNQMIRLEVDQSSDSISQKQIDGASDIVTNKRSIKTEVLVKSGNTIVLGGLIDDRSSETESRIPLLGSIPVLGALFRSTTVDYNKNKLLVLIRPTIIDGQEQEISERKFKDVWEIDFKALDELSSDEAPSFDSLYQGRLK